MTDPSTPPLVQEMLDELTNAGLDPQVEQRHARFWRITVTSDRVTVTVDFRRNPAGQLKWAGSTLTVDGEDRPLARDAAHLADIFHDPDAQTAAPAMPPAAPVAAAPPAVQHQYRVLVAKCGQGMVSLGRQGHDWLIGLDNDDAATRIRFSRLGGTQKKRYWMSGIVLVIGGVDYTRQVGNDLSEALRLLGGAGQPEAPQSTGAPDTHGPRSNAVETRRATVIRN